MREYERVAGEIELMSPERNTAKAQRLFERALEIARAQQARSWELRAAASLARLWRDQGCRAEAHDLLAPVYGWFTKASKHSIRKRQGRCWKSWRSAHRLRQKAPDWEFRSRSFREGNFVWSALDNPEWTDGYGIRLLVYWIS